MLGVWNLEFSTENFPRKNQNQTDQEYWEEVETKMFFPLDTFMDTNYFWNHMVDSRESLKVTKMGKNILQAVVEFFISEMVFTISNFTEKFQVNSSPKFQIYFHQNNISSEAVEIFLQMRNLPFLISSQKWKKVTLVDRNPPYIQESPSNSIDNHIRNRRREVEWSKYNFLTDHQPYELLGKDVIPLWIHTSHPYHNIYSESPVCFPAGGSQHLRESGFVDQFFHWRFFSRFYYPADEKEARSLHPGIAVYQLKQRKIKATYLPPETFIIDKKARNFGVPPIVFLMAAQSYWNNWLQDALLIGEVFSQVVSTKELKWVYFLRNGME